MIKVHIEILNINNIISILIADIFKIKKNIVIIIFVEIVFMIYYFYL